VPRPRSDYSVIAGYYDRFRSASPAAHGFWLGHLIRLGQMSSSSRVLDLGCGTGRLAIPLSRHLGAAVWAFDRSEAMLGQAIGKEGSQRVAWAAGDAQAVPCPADTFDCVFLAMVVHHVENRPLALASVYRALRPGGRLVIWTASHRQIRRFFLGPFFPSLIPIDLDRFPPIGSLMSEARAAGFVHVSRQSVVKRERANAQDLLERVRNRYISTLSLIPEREFAAGVEAFSGHVASLPDDRIRRAYRYTFVTGCKAA
jgi:ubiquinone/menaquinone biosynthesis C-methylase UbiE